jgi:aspartate aminotransferase-like enzyme
VNKFETDLLLIPGPTPVPPPIQRALAEPILSHRGSEFKGILGRVAGGLQRAFQTEGEVILLASSGTGAMEAAISNTLAPGDRVLCVVNGKFGARFAEISERRGLEVTRLAFDPGKGADPAAVAAALDRGRYKALTLVHNETSTAVTNPTKEIVAAAKAEGVLTIVDCVSGLLAVEFAMDEWGIDIAVSGSQKGLCLPPGLGFVAVRNDGWKAIEAGPTTPYYFDLRAARKSQAKGETAFTPAIGIVRALEVALELLLRDGLEAVIERHRVMAKAVRAAVAAMDLRLFADPTYASDAVTSILPPEGIDPDALRSDLKKRFDIVVSGGQDELKGRIFRIAHMGAVAPYQLLGALAALEVVLRDAGHTTFAPGAGAAAAGAVFGQALR